MTDYNPTAPRFPFGSAPSTVAEAPAPAPAPVVPAFPQTPAPAPAPALTPAPAPAPAPAPLVAPAPAPALVQHQPAAPESFPAPDAEPNPEGAQPASPAHDDDAEPPQTRREARTPGKPRTRERDRDKERERALIRRTAAKSQELAILDGDARNLLAGILAVAPTTYDLTVAVMTASAKDYQSAVDALTVIDADVVEAAVEAAALGRPRVKAVWQLVARAGHLTAEMPASDVKAAVALVRALRDGIDTVAFRAQVEDALALIKR